MKNTDAATRTEFFKYIWVGCCKSQRSSLAVRLATFSNVIIAYHKIYRNFWLAICGWMNNVEHLVFSLSLNIHFHRYLKPVKSALNDFIMDMNVIYTYSIGLMEWAIFQSMKTEITEKNRNKAKGFFLWFQYNVFMNRLFLQIWQSTHNNRIWHFNSFIDFHFLFVSILSVCVLFPPFYTLSTFSILLYRFCCYHLSSLPSVQCSIGVHVYTNPCMSAPIVQASSIPKSSTSKHTHTHTHLSITRVFIENRKKREKEDRQNTSTKYYCVE